jgi:hypothetical protein
MSSSVPAKAVLIDLRYPGSDAERAEPIQVSTAKSTSLLGLLASRMWFEEFRLATDYNHPRQTWSADRTGVQAAIDWLVADQSVGCKRLLYVIGKWTDDDSVDATENAVNVRFSGFDLSSEEIKSMLHARLVSTDVNMLLRNETLTVVV